MWGTRRSKSACLKGPIITFGKFLTKLQQNNKHLTMHYITYIYMNILQNKERGGEREEERSERLKIHKRLIQNCNKWRL